jgi:hypothetical protein
MKLLFGKQMETPSHSHKDPENLGEGSTVKSDGHFLFSLICPQACDDSRLKTQMAGIRSLPDEQNLLFGGNERHR